MAKTIAMNKGLLLTPLLVCTFLLTAFAQQWVQSSVATPSDFDGIHFFDDTLGIIGGGFINTYTTQDGGKTWTGLSAQGFRDYDFFDDTYGFGASIVGRSMGYTSDGGATWSKITPPTSNSLWAVSAVGPRTAYFTGTCGVLWKTTNGGLTVRVLNSGTYDLITDVMFSNENTGIIVMQLDGIAKTTNGGLTWKTVHSNSSLKRTYTEMHFVDDNLGFVLGKDRDEGGFVMKTTDGGDTWTQLNIHANSAYMYGIDFFDANHGVVVGNEGDLYYTADAGQTWLRQLSDRDSTNLKDVHMFSATSAVIIGDDGFIARNEAIDQYSSIESTQLTKTQIFPNPAKDFIAVDWSANEGDLVLYSQNGSLVMQHVALTNGINKIDVSGLDPGVYVARIRSEIESNPLRFIKI